MAMSQLLAMGYTRGPIKLLAENLATFTTHLFSHSVIRTKIATADNTVTGACHILTRPAKQEREGTTLMIYGFQKSKQNGHIFVDVRRPMRR